MDVPVTLYACEPSAEKLLALLQELFPDQDVRPDNPRGEWEVEITAGTAGMIFKKALKLTFNHAPDYYQGDEWPTQREGMINYFARGWEPDDEQFLKSANLIRHIRFAVSIQSNPPLSGEDERYELISHLANALDGFLFLPGALLDANFEALLELEGGSSPDATFPKVPDSENSGSSPESRANVDGEEDEEIDPPTAERVAKRMLVLMAIAARSIAEMNVQEHPELAEMHERILPWMEELGIADECEPGELAALECPLGKLPQQPCIDGFWRTEGVAVLAWALGLHELSDYDEGTTTDALLQELAFLNTEQGESILQNAALRSPEEIGAMGEAMLAFHWRMRDFRINPKPCDFRNWGETCWFGPTDLSWAKFGPDNDLMIRGKSISIAVPDDVSMASSIAMERHLATNWLRGSGFSRVYSEVDTST